MLKSALSAKFWRVPAYNPELQNFAKIKSNPKNLADWGCWGYDYQIRTQQGKRMDSRKLMAEVKADGWILVRINGSHHHFTHPTKKGLVTIPHPKKDLPIKTVKSIRKQAGI